VPPGLRLYAKVGEKTPTRDLNDPWKLNLVQKDNGATERSAASSRRLSRRSGRRQQKLSLEDGLAERPPIDEGPTLFDDRRDTGRVPLRDSPR
jgi:hypothetical protein